MAYASASGEKVRRQLSRPPPASSAKWTRMKKTDSSGSPNCWLSAMLPPPSLMARATA
jgi:hypothetical protein